MCLVGVEEETQPCYSPNVSSMSAFLKKWKISRIWSWHTKVEKEGEEGKKTSKKNSSIHDAMQDSEAHFSVLSLTQKHELQIGMSPPGLVSCWKPMFQLYFIINYSPCKGASIVSKKKHSKQVISEFEHSNSLKHSTPKK